ncbi:TIGR04282 family arsenosugar biosynthesis glycosyltransferase [Leptolyngbya sp. FACHB-17]|uniref:TIGR04282 family arsenosugar biosynthesis glycosyltransferase n=1 Tax=unclassified Leptolyngbya TaxID=2650499 RepID=UPI001681BEDE|nr:TIGR04282 family arsenosugar biosynthesis glycosyltransferase [Leptolyngbya sp. FACHB-17]
MQEQLIIFTRYPEPGKAKTRLIPALGEVGAAALHRQMTEAMIAQSRKLKNDRSVSICVYYTGGTLIQMQDWLGHDLEYRSQCSGDLGDRLIDAFHSAFDSGARSVVAVGTDCPDLTADVLTTAFLKLNYYNLSIGAATDGGYYLIGLNQFVASIFQGITWSTNLVFQQTLEIAKQLNLSIALLPTLNDIDRPEDLRHLP